MKRNHMVRMLVLCALIVAASVSFAQVQPRALVTNATTGAGPGVTMALPSQALFSPAKTFQVSITGTGALTATVNIEVSNDGVNYGPTPLAVFTMSCTPPSVQCTQLTAANAPYVYVRANVTALTGTSAAITASMYP